MRRQTAWLLLLAFLFCGISVSFAESATYTPGMSLKETMEIVQNTHPTELDLGKVKWTPSQLAELKSMMADPSGLRFQAVFCKTDYTESTEEIDLNGSSVKISQEELLALISLLPHLKSVNVVKHRELSNDIMCGIVESFPEISFTWLISLPYSHSLSSAFTAYSTMNNVGPERRMKEEKLDVFRYTPEMRALDLGHNAIADLHFLELMPELRLLILADNKITDITPIGQLKHLQYCEIFMNKITDLSAFSQCTELLDLNIVSTSITSLDGLEGCVKLERLWAPRKENLDPESIERFVAAHPECEITFNKNDCTGKGWRKHWRYKHYISCFKTHTWIPFEESTFQNAVSSR